MVTVTIKKERQDSSAFTMHVKSTKDKEANFICVVELLMNALGSLMKQVAAEHPDARGDIYDRINSACGLLLENFYPEYDKQPDLTVEAIKTLEDYIIEKKINDMPADERKAAMNAAVDFFKQKTAELRLLNNEVSD